MQNRYEEELRKNNQAILKLSPANDTLRFIVAMEFNKIYSDGKKALEIGCGEGDSARHILENSGATLDLLDISPEMIEESQKNLSQYSGRIKYICEDGLSYLERSGPYDIIYSEWTIHNFKWEDKEKLLSAIYKNLAPGGWFIFMDKVYPDVGGEDLLNLQLNRYRYLSEQGCKEISDHEKQDYLDEFRMNETQFLEALEKAGFISPVIVDRVERDLLIIAQK
jgi:ubiquinone/menaquinone biosynthesis C-methylase UbiE